MHRGKKHQHAYISARRQQHLLEFLHNFVTILQASQDKETGH